MQAYVNKVLARGRTQRSKSVSCSEGQSGRKNKVWRKPDVVPSLENTSQEKSRTECDVDVLKHAEDKSKTFSVDVSRASQCTNDIVSVETSKPPRKRISSEVSPAQDYRSFDELKRMKIGRENDFVHVVESDKANHNPTQHGRLKQRSYSTSIVQESAERNPLGVNPIGVKRSPLAPLNRLQVKLRSTYDVIPELKQVFQDTYTKHSSCRASIDEETASYTGLARENQTSINSCGETVNHKNPKSERRGSNMFVAKDFTDLKSDNATSAKRQTHFLKVLLGSSHMVFRSISPESSLKEYVQAMKSTLEESLGLEMFTALHKYLCFDVEKDLDCGMDICETFFQALGQDGIVFVPLLLQYIQCENNLATK